MRYAICNELFEGWDVGRICRFAASAGYEGIELAPFTLPTPVRGLAAEQRAEIRRTVENAGIRVAALHWLLAKTEGYHVTHPDHAVRKATAEYLSELARLTADLGGRVMVFGSPKQRSVPEGLTREQGWVNAKETFVQMLPALEETGVTFCLEPLGPEETDFINAADEALRMVGEIGHPRFRMVLDVKAMSTEAREIPDIIRSSAGYFAHFHANDANRHGPGFGQTDFRPIARALKEVGYDGWVSVEPFDYSPDPETVAQRSIAYLREVFSHHG